MGSSSSPTFQPRLAFALAFMAACGCSSSKAPPAKVGSLEQLRETVDEVARLAAAIQNSLKDCRTRHPGARAPYDKKLHREIAKLDTLRRPLLLVLGLLDTEAHAPQNLARLDSGSVKRLWRFLGYSQELNKHLRSLFTESDAVVKAKQIAGGDPQHGMVFSYDQGQFYLGRVVPIEKPFCLPASKPCRREDIQGFHIWTGGKSSKRFGKPRRGVKFTDIVVPLETSSFKIVPTDDVIGRYGAGFAALEETVNKLAELGQPLMNGLRSQTASDGR